MHTFMNSKEIAAPSVTAGMGAALMLLLLILLGTFHPVFSVAACFYMLHILLRNETGGMILLFLLMPFAGIFKLAPGSTSLFTYIELLYVFLHYARKRFLLSEADLLLIVLAFCMVIAEMLSHTIAVTNTIKLLVNLLLLEQFLALSQMETRKKTYLWFVWGVILASFTSLFLTRIFPIERFLAINHVEQYGQYGEKVIRFSGLNADPNYYTVNVILALCLLIVLYRRKEISTVKICILASALGVFAALTGSKSAFLMLGAVIVIYLVACYQGRRYLMLTVSCVVLTAGIIAVFSGQIALFSNVLLRFQRSMTDLNSLTTGRAGIWLNYLQYFVTHPGEILLGQGVGLYVLYGRAAHNTYIDMIYQLGIVGTAVYLCCLACIVRRHREPFRRRFLNYSGFMCVLTMYFFLSQLQGYDLPFHLFLCTSLWNTQNETAQYPGLEGMGGSWGQLWPDY